MDAVEQRRPEVPDWGEGLAGPLLRTGVAPDPPQTLRMWSSSGKEGPAGPS
jgi:hypothetical protein